MCMPMNITQLYSEKTTPLNKTSVVNKKKEEEYLTVFNICD